MYGTNKKFPHIVRSEVYPQVQTSSSFRLCTSSLAELHWTLALCRLSDTVKHWMWGAGIFAVCPTFPDSQLKAEGTGPGQALSLHLSFPSHRCRKERKEGWDTEINFTTGEGAASTGLHPLRLYSLSCPRQMCLFRIPGCPFPRSQRVFLTPCLYWNHLDGFW